MAVFPKLELNASPHNILNPLNPIKENTYKYTISAPVGVTKRPPQQRYPVRRERNPPKTNDIPCNARMCGQGKGVRGSKLLLYMSTRPLHVVMSAEHFQQDPKVCKLNTKNLQVLHQFRFLANADPVIRNIREDDKGVWYDWVAIQLHLF
eukprot:5304995-Amphidinium_carterae.1